MYTPNIQDRTEPGKWPQVHPCGHCRFNSILERLKTSEFQGGVRKQQSGGTAARTAESPGRRQTGSPLRGVQGAYFPMRYANQLLRWPTVNRVSKAITS